MVDKQIDDQLKKTQAFHIAPTPTIGGIGIFLSLLAVYFYFIFFKSIFFLEYLSFCTLFFLHGFIDDLKINFNPKIHPQSFSKDQEPYLDLLQIDRTFQVQQT